MLPVPKLEIVMVGMELSKKVDGKVVEKGKVKITIRKGCYDKIKLSRPSVVIGNDCNYCVVENLVDMLI